MLKIVYESILTLVYPQECRNCSNSVEHSADGVACRECWDKVRVFSGSEVLCEKCGAYLGKTGDSRGVSCRQCDDHSYDRAFAAGIYEHALAATVLHLKSKPHLCHRTQEMLSAAYSAASLDKVALIVPVPLSRKRSHARGYNQAEILGSFLAKRFGVPLKNDILIRKTHTPIHRAGMDKKARELTVRNAFEITEASRLNGANILLVDDVFTSGATVSNCARILKKSGAGRVDVMTLARAV